MRCEDDKDYVLFWKLKGLPGVLVARKEQGGGCLRQGWTPLKQQYTSVQMLERVLSWSPVALHRKHGKSSMWQPRLFSWQCYSPSCGMPSLRNHQLLSGNLRQGWILAQSLFFLKERGFYLSGFCVFDPVVGYIIYVTAFNPQGDAGEVGRWGSWGSAKPTVLPEVTQLTNRKMRLWIESCVQLAWIILDWDRVKLCN